jgi:hypothetical protein
LVIALAYRMGRARLIDNVLVEAGKVEAGKVEAEGRGRGSKLVESSSGRESRS